MNAELTSTPPTTPAVGWLRGVIVDAIDVERLGAFWQQVLGVGIGEQRIHDAFALSEVPQYCCTVIADRRDSETLFL